MLLTEATPAWLGIDAAQPGLAAHVERYDHLGEVRCFVREVEVPVAA